MTEFSPSDWFPTLLRRPATFSIGLALLKMQPHRGDIFVDRHAERFPSSVGAVSFHPCRPDRASEDLLLGFCKEVAPTELPKNNEPNSGWSAAQKVSVGTSAKAGWPSDNPNGIASA